MDKQFKTLVRAISNLSQQSFAAGYEAAKAELFATEKHPEIHPILAKRQAALIQTYVALENLMKSQQEVTHGN